MFNSLFKIVVMYLVLLFVFVVSLLIIDPNYFDYPIATAETGLPKDQAPQPPFATSLTFEASRDYAVNIVMTAKDQPLNIRAELLTPDGRMGLDQSFPLPQSTPSVRKWKSVLAATTMNGTYTLRITQDAPGLIKVYFFQGPFVARLFAIPLLTAIILGILFGTLRRRFPSLQLDFQETSS